MASRNRGDSGRRHIVYYASNGEIHYTYWDGNQTVVAGLSSGNGIGLALINQYQPFTAYHDGGYQALRDGVYVVIQRFLPLSLQPN